MFRFVFQLSLRDLGARLFFSPSAFISQLCFLLFFFNLSSLLVSLSTTYLPFPFRSLIPLYYVVFFFLISLFLSSDISHSNPTILYTIQLPSHIGCCALMINLWMYDLIPTLRLGRTFTQSDCAQHPWRLHCASGIRTGLLYRYSSIIS